MLKRLFLISCFATRLFAASEDNELNSALACKLSTITLSASSTRDAIKNIIEFFINNEQQLSLLDKKTMWHFIDNFAHRWTNDWNGQLVFWFGLYMSDFCKDQKEVEIAEYFQKCLKVYIDEYNALEKALDQGDLPLIRGLLENGVPCKKIIGGFLRKNIDKEQLLLEAGIDQSVIDEIQKVHELNRAIYNNDSKKIEDAIAAGFDLNKITSYAPTPLAYASFYARSAMIELLVSYGADINGSVNGKGDTPLMVALDHRNRHRIEHVNLLLRLGADINKKNKDGFMALNIAYQECNDLGFSTLVKAGADPACISKIVFDWQAR